MYSRLNLCSSFLMLLTILWLCQKKLVDNHYCTTLLQNARFVDISWECFQLCLQGMVFDLEKGSTLHIDLAKTNSRSKRSRTGLLLVVFPPFKCFHLIWWISIILNVFIWLWLISDGIICTCWLLRLDDEWTGSDKKARGSSSFSRGIPDSGK